MAKVIPIKKREKRTLPKLTEKRSISVWISKYALSRGIFQAQATKSRHYDTVIYADMKIGGKTVAQAFAKGQWHFLKSDAQHAASEMRRKEVDRLQKRIGKLKRMIF